MEILNTWKAMSNDEEIRNNNEIPLFHLRKYWIIIFRGRKDLEISVGLKEALSLFKNKKYAIGFVAVKVMCRPQSENTIFETGQEERVMQ